MREERNNPDDRGLLGVSRQGEPALTAYLKVLRRRKWILLGCALLVPLAAFFFSARQEKLYQSSAEVYLNKSDIGSAITGISNPALYVDEGRAAETQANLALVPAVAQLALDNAAITNMSVNELLGEISVAAKGNSDILGFTITDPDPKRAERLASAYALAFTQYRGELDGASITTARQEVDTKLAQLEAQGKKDSPLYDNLVESEQQLATLETLKTSRASVVREAGSAFQVAPTPKRNAALGLALGLVLGIGLAFALDALDTRVRSTSEIADLLGLTLLARLPAPPKDVAKAEALVMLARPKGAHAEAFRMLRTNIEFARLEGDDIRTIMVTSAVEEEGKSTTTANLAIALARSGSRVALVDLDLRRPFLHRFFDISHAQGVTDVALGWTTVAAALRPIDISASLLLANGAGPEETASHGRLDVLVSGPLPPDPGEFVGTQRLAAILAELRASHDMVIIDTPPLLRVGDAMTLSGHTDGILVVTRLNMVRRPMLGELSRQLKASPAPKLGFVVTGGGDDGGGYGDGYQYGYGYGDSRSHEKQPRGADLPVKEIASTTTPGVAVPRETETT